MVKEVEALIFTTTKPLTQQQMIALQREIMKRRETADYYIEGVSVTPTMVIAYVSPKRVGLMPAALIPAVASAITAIAGGLGVVLKFWAASKFVAALSKIAPVLIFAIVAVTAYYLFKED